MPEVEEEVNSNHIKVIYGHLYKKMNIDEVALQWKMTLKQAKSWISKSKISLRIIAHANIPFMKKIVEKLPYKIYRF